MEKLYWDTIKFNDRKLYFTVNNNGLNFISDLDQQLSQIYDFYPTSQFEFRNQRDATSRYVDQFEDYLLGETNSVNLPIDISEAGNADFQKIWHLIRTIPYGSFLTAQDVAEKTNEPKAIVMQALRETPLPIVIPVHRVICQQDITSAVRGGSAMRSQLLEMEAMNGLNDLE